MALPPPSIQIDPPTEDLSGPLVFGNEVASVDPYFALNGNPRVREMFSSLYPQVHSAHKGYNDQPAEAVEATSCNYYSENFDHSYDPIAQTNGAQTQNNFPYPFDFVSHSAQRNEVFNSPFTTESSSVDAFEDTSLSPHTLYSSLNSPNSPWNHPSPLVSPLVQQLETVLLGQEIDGRPERPSIFRNRSYSTVEVATVAPSEIWSEPGMRVRSATVSGGPSTSGINTFSGHTMDAKQDSGAELDGIDLDNVNFSFSNNLIFGDAELAPFTSSPYSDSLESSGSASPMPPSVPSNDLSTSSTLFAPDPSAFNNTVDIIHPQPRRPSTKQPVALSLQTDLNTQPASHRAFHYRRHSDTAGLLSPESPIDRRRERSLLRAHSPYPSPYSSPLSSSSDGLSSTRWSNDDFDNAVLFNTTQPSASEGSSLRRRHTSSHSLSAPALTTDGAQLRRAVTHSSAQYGVHKRRNMQASPALSLSSLHLGSPSTETRAMGEGLDIKPPSADSILSDIRAKASPEDHKDVVASEKIVHASNLRRTREARFKCEECSNTFTAKHNLHNHMRSHNGIKPFECPSCHDKFTTQGVRARHLDKCAPHIASEGKRKRRSRK